MICSGATCAPSPPVLGVLISKWVVGDPALKSHPRFVGASGTNCFELGSPGCRLWDGDWYTVSSLVNWASIPIEDKRRTGQEEGLGRGRGWRAMQFQLSPQSNLWAALKLEWLFWIVLSWGEGAGPHFDQPCSVGSSGNEVRPSLFRQSLYGPESWGLSAESTSRAGE